MLNYNAYGWLTTCPINDGNYKSALRRATGEELRKAIEYLTGKPGSKGKILACTRELHRRSKEVKEYHDR